MECYEGAKMIKTFRGQLGDGDQDTISLHTNDGKTGYRVVKFQTIGQQPGVTPLESVCKIYSVPQTSIDGVVNFSDSTLLAVCTYARHEDVLASGEDELVIFDKEIFNQDIYITAFDSIGALPTNYYLELEQIPLDLNSSTVATLQNIRGS